MTSTNLSQLKEVILKAIKKAGFEMDLDHLNLEINKTNYTKKQKK